MQVSIEQITNQQHVNDYLELQELVFVNEQKIAREHVFDQQFLLNQKNIQMFGAFSNDKLIGALRIITQDTKYKITRLCVNPEFRGQKIATKLIEYVLNQYTDFNIMVSSQINVIKLYKSLNFRVCSSPYVIAGIKHVDLIYKQRHPFKYSNTNKRYHTLDYHFKEIFGEKVGRISINAGFTCPNIDGTAAFGGCTFCSIKGSGDYAGHPQDHLLKQWEMGKKRMKAKWPNAKYLAYFQAFTNTYAPVEILEEKFEIFANREDCVGISIGTRPDCLEDDVIEYLADLSKRTYLIVELGLQSMYDKTAKIINRGHDLACFEESLQKLRSHNINVIVHTINGLPGEDYEMMMNTHRYLAKQDIQGIKIHLLHVMSDTALVNQINNGFLKLMDRQDYINLVVDQLELFKPEVVIHRLTGDAPSENFIGPIWSHKKVSVLNDIDKEFVRRGSFQGSKYDY